MRSLDNRLTRLERRNIDPELPDLEVTIISSEQQVQHPERFTKILVEEETGESGINVKTYQLEPRSL